MRKNISNKRGFTLLEVIIALAIMAIFMGAGISLFLSVKQGSNVNSDYVRASFLLKEGINAVRSIRDTNFLSLQDGVYGLSRGASSYELIDEPDVTDNIFMRTITVSSLYRDNNGNIAESGELDLSAKKVSIEINFSGLGGISRSVSSQTYLADWASAEIVHTLLSDFTSADKTNIGPVPMPTPPVNNGALKLETTYTESGFYSTSNIGAHANDVYGIGSTAYLATGMVNKGLVVVDIGNSNSLNILKELDVGGKAKAVHASDNVLALAVEKNDGGLAFVNISTPASAALLSQLNIGANGIKVLMSGNNTFVTTDKANGGLVIVNHSNPSVPTILKTVNLGNVGSGLAIYGNYLYVGVKNVGVNVYNIQSPANPVLVQQFIVGNGYANAIAVDFPYVFMSTKNASQDVYIARMNDQGVLTLISSLTLASNGDTTDVAISGKDLIVGTGDTNKGVVVINVENPSSPNIFEYKDVNAKVQGIAIIGQLVGVTTDTNNEGFILIGAGNRGYTSSGNYTSNAIDTGADAPEFLSVGYMTSLPPQATISIQLRAADTAGELSETEWSEAYSISPSILSLPSKRFIQYKVSMTGDGNSTPVLDVINIEYLP